MRKIWRWDVIAGLCLINGYRMGAELGVKEGRFTSYLCSTMRDMRMTAVDLWQVLPGRDAEGAETYAGVDMERLYQNFSDHCGIHLGNRVEVLRMDTAEAAQHVQDGSLDFVFIDADHTYEGCLRDIKAWTPKVRAGGVIAGHDFNDAWTGVQRAVKETGKFALAPDSVWIRAAK